MLTVVRKTWGQHKHSAPRPTGTAWELQKQLHVKGTNKVWGRDRWTGMSCNQESDRLSQQQWVGKSFRPKREMDMDLHGCKLEREHTWIYTNMSRTAPEKRNQGSRRGKGGKGWIGQQNKNPRFKKYIAHFRKNTKAAFNCALHQWQEGTPKCPQTAAKLLELFLIPSQRRD